MTEELETLQEILDKEKQRIWPDSLEYTVIADKRIKALTAGVEALEKQIPLEPVEMDVEEYALGEITTGQCPKCRFPVDVLRRYCPNCGQRLDWSEVEE